MNVSDTIRILVTGGTFDKEYNLITGQLFFRDTHLPAMLDRGRSTLNIDVDTLMMVDSVDMTDEQRQIVIDNCIDAQEDKLIITHGTDTMVETAQILAQIGITNKTIVITGAMIPYHFGNSSDGFFNLGSALAFVQTLPRGVYISMHGRYFNWDNVFKNKKTGYFQELKEANAEV